MIPFYTQVQNCPFSSWQSKIFEIYPKNSKVVPANFPSLPFIYSSGRLSHPKSAECLCRSPLCITRYGEAKADKRRPARAVLCRSFGTPKQRGIPRHVPDRHDVSPSFAVLPTVSFHSGPAVPQSSLFYIPFIHILSIPLYRLPSASFCLAMPSGFVGRKGLSSCLNRPD